MRLSQSHPFIAMTILPCRHCERSEAIQKTKQTLVFISGLLRRCAPRNDEGARLARFRRNDERSRQESVIAFVLLNTQNDYSQ